MRIKRLLTLLIVLVCASANVQARDSDAQGKSKLQGFLRSMSQLESKARAIQPMHIPLKGRTRAQDQEMTKRIEFLDNLNSKDATALGREIRDYQAPQALGLQHESVRKTWEMFKVWLDTKLSLQNAGVNNPGLQSLKRREPEDYNNYLQQRRMAEAALKG